MRRDHDPDAERERFQRRHDRPNALAWLLDSAIRLPGGFRIGLDALVGLLPGFGDMAGVLVSAYLMRQAARLGAPPSLLLRMGMNVAIDGLIGMIPFLGDIFDAAWKANLRNARLLNRYLDNPVAATRSNRIFAGVLLFLLIVFMSLMSVVSFLVMRWIWHALQG